MTGAWEAAVAQVVVAGQPRTIYSLAHAWKRLADGMPDHQAKLGEMVTTLCGGQSGWRGKASGEYQKIVKDLIKEITDLQNDCTQMASDLAGTADSLSKAIARIPIPLAKTGTFDVDHVLPNGTAMDDHLHDPNTFDSSLVDDYGRNPGAYRDFKAFIWRYGSDAMRHAHGGDRDYHGHYSSGRSFTEKDVDAWYNANAAVADTAFRRLRQQYTDQRSGYVAVSRTRDAETAHGTQSPARPGDGAGSTGDSLSGGSSWSGSPAGYAGRTTSLAGYGHATSDGSRGIELDGSGQAQPGVSWRSSGGTELSAAPGGGVSGASGVPGAASIGGGAGAGGAGGGGAGLSGALSPGSHWSGPDQAPMPPTTTVQQSVAERATGRSGLGSRASSAGEMGGMVPQGSSGGRKDAEERSTWLTEDDEDIFRAEQGPPGLIE